MSLEHLKSRIKEIPISEILGHYLEIVPSGKRKTALCPFHDDSNPSLNIDDDKGMWYCFVDNMGGDAIKFVQLHLNVGFVDALKEICVKLGWNWDEFDRGQKASPKRELGYKILTRAASLYRRYAQEGNAKVFSKFLEERGLSEETAEIHEIGFVPKHNILCNYLNSIGDEKERTEALKWALELGIIRTSKYKDGEYYDTFKNRIVFPLRNHFGKVVGFTGRATLPEQKGKYINSSESFLFNKNSVLYGLHEAKNSIRQKNAVIVVEGHMDKIALSSHGFTHTVAVMGTALGRSGLQALLGLTKNIYLALDGDDAGLKASERINAQFMEEGKVLPKYIDLSPHKDPDELIQGMGSLEFQKRLEEAVSTVDFCYSRSLPQKIPELTERKLELLYGLYRLLKPLGTGLQAKEKIAFWAKRLGLQSDLESIYQDYVSYCGEGQRGAATKPKTSPREKASSIAPKNNESVLPSKRESHLGRGEKVLLQEVVLHPQILKCEKFQELLDLTQNNEVKLFILGLGKLWDKINDREYERVLLAYLSGDEYSLELTTFIGGLVPKYRSGQINNAMLLKTVEQVKQTMCESKIREKRERLKEKQRVSKTYEESNQLLMEFSQLDKEFAELKAARNRLN